MSDGLKLFIKVVLVFLASMLAIITNSEVLNMYTFGNTDVFHVVCAGVNFAVEGYLIYLFAKNKQNVK